MSHSASAALPRDRNLGRELYNSEQNVSNRRWTVRTLREGKAEKSPFVQEIRETWRETRMRRVEGVIPGNVESFVDGSEGRRRSRPDIHRRKPTPKLRGRKTTKHEVKAKCHSANCEREKENSSLGADVVANRVASRVGGGFGKGTGGGATSLLASTTPANCGLREQRRLPSRTLKSVTEESAAPIGRD